MTETLVLACLWVLVTTGVALLPKRAQRWPAAAMAMIAPVLIGLIWQEHGIFVALLCLAAVASMFRHPLQAICTGLRPRVL